MKNSGSYFKNQEVYRSCRYYVIPDVLLVKRLLNGWMRKVWNMSTEIYKEKNPKKSELKKWIKASGLPAKKFFNTSGQLYKALGLKDKLPKMSEDEQLRLLASDGMLVKRPLLIGEDFVLVGFKPGEWAEKGLV